MRTRMPKGATSDASTWEIPVTLVSARDNFEGLLELKVRALTFQSPFRCRVETHGWPGGES